MPNGMPSWEEWDKQLSEEQRRYSLYKVLSDLYHRDCDRDKTCHERLVEYNHEFSTLKKRKWLDRGAALIGGAVSGFLGALGMKFGG